LQEKNKDDFFGPADGIPADREKVLNLGRKLYIDDDFARITGPRGEFEESCDIFAVRMVVDDHRM
jgi:hypothetical protein